MKKKLLILFIAFFFVFPVTAQTTFGNRDCGKWVKERADKPKSNLALHTYETWLIGYLSGYTRAHPETDRKIDPLDLLSSADQAYLWMDNYCRNNPLETLLQGAEKLFDELLARAKKK